MNRTDSTASGLNRRQIEEKIVALAWKDDGFRKSFLDDPKATFEKHLGTKLPAELKMTAHADDEDHLHFVIPARPAPAAELSDEDLEKVAGGIDAVLASIIVATAVVGSAYGSVKLNREVKWA